jgi:hypothetical protein
MRVLVDQLYAHVVPSNLTYDFLDQKIDIDSLNYQSNKVNIVDLSQNCLTELDKQAYHKFLQTSDSVIILHPDPRIHDESVIYYPFWQIYGMREWERNNFTYSRNCIMSCLNGNPHEHRWYIYRNLIKMDYNDVMYSFHNNSHYDLNYTNCGSELSHYFQQEKHSFPERSSNDLSISHDAYKKSFVNLVTETSIEDNLFISEKTWKPIASGQFFIIAGPKGIIKYLRETGIDVYDDIVDHSYDTIADWRIRMDAVLQSVNKLINQDLNMLFAQTSARRKQNVEHFFSGSIAQPYLEKLEKLINSKLPQHLYPNTDSI